MHVLLASVSVNSELKTIGAIAGLVAIPGLAVLSLLYFGQAREVKRLREWAGRAPERAQELQERVVEKASAARTVPPAATPAAGKRVVAQPVPGRDFGPRVGTEPGDLAIDSSFQFIVQNYAEILPTFLDNPSSFFLIEAI